jgi:hypothetical protein
MKTINCIIFSLWHNSPTQAWVEVSKSHTIRHKNIHVVGLLRTSDQLVAVATTYTTHNKQKRETSMPSVRLELTILASEWPQTYTTGIGINEIICGPKCEAYIISEITFKYKKHEYVLKSIKVCLIYCYNLGTNSSTFTILKEQFSIFRILL